jgi:hypothetical protein
MLVNSFPGYKHCALIGIKGYRVYLYLAPKERNISAPPDQGGVNDKCNLTTALKGRNLEKELK